MNVFSWVNDYDDITNNKTFNGSLNLNWNINKYFSYSLRAGGNIVVNDRKRWYGIQLPPGENVKGLLAISNVNKSNYTVENLLNFNMDLTKDFRLSATAGITYDEYHFLTENVSGNTFSIYDLRTKGLSNAGKVDVKQPIQKDYQLLSYLGRVNLSAYDKYLLTASLRADGSSKFKKGNRWAYFPSFSLAWRMEQEAYMKSIDWLSQLKVRVGYGETGNQGIDPYQSLSIYENKVDYADGDGNKLTSMQIKSLQNEGLKWERTSSWNAGLDFGFFNGRLNGAFDYYRKSGSKYGKYQMASLLLTKNVSATENPIELLKELSNANYGDAQFYLGLLYFHGNSRLKKDQAMGLDLIKQSANNGCKDASDWLKKRNRELYY